MARTYWGYILVALIAIVFCLRLVHEPDLWWQLRTGEYILENGSVPKTDVFSYTYAGLDWLNVKWGFEVIQAKTVQLFGPQFLFLPQLLANLLMLFFMLKTTLMLAQEKRLSKPIIAIAMLLFLVGLSYRMNGRPELTSYTFTAFYLFVFANVWRGNTKWIYTIIPAQILWTNMHEGYGIGMVMLVVYVVSIWFSFSRQSVKGSIQRKALIQQTAIALLSLFSVTIHPSGTKMLLHPYTIFTQLSDNTFTQEIYAFTDKAYWQMPAFVGLFIGLIAFLEIYKTAKPTKKLNLNSLFEVYPPFYVILFFAFFYLSLNSYRNFPLLLVISTPIVALQLQAWLGRFSKPQVTGAFVFLSIGLYVSITTNTFYKTFLPNETYGIGINSAKNPLGTSAFIKKNNLNGPAFSDYLISSYLLWSLQPDFKTFVDLRDLDVFEAEDIQLSLILCNEPTRRLASGQTAWETVSARYPFNYVTVLNNAEFLPLQRHLMERKDYDLVFADELSAVFAKKVKQNHELLHAKGYRSGNFTFSALQQDETSKAGSALSTLFWPFYTPNKYSSERYKKAETAYFEALGLPKN